MMSKEIQAQLKQYFAQLQEPVSLLLDSDESKEGRALADLIEGVVACSDKLILEYGNLARTPMVRISNSASEINFAGAPSGHEFNSLILAILHLGGHPTKANDAQKGKIATIKEPKHVEIFMSLSCQNCPEVVQAMNTISALNPLVNVTTIDGAVFPDEASERKVMAVPSLFVDGELVVQGRQSLDQLIEILGADVSQEAELWSNKAVFDSLVIGGGPAGASSAIYSARKGINTGLVVDRFGGQVQETVAIENFISVNKTEGPKLASHLENHVKDYDVDIMTGVRVVELDRSANGIINVTLSNGSQLATKSAVIATGARWRKLNVKGELEYTGKGVAYCPHCDGPLFKGKSVAVIGGGNSGVEAAIDLAGITEHVTVLEFGDALRADQVLQDKLKSLSNVTVILSAQTNEVLGDGTEVNGLSYKDRVTGEYHSIALAGVFVQIGLVPNSEFLPAGIETNQMGEIIVDQTGATSMPGVFAAGDVTNSSYKQIIIAMGSGATASLSSFDYLIRNTIGEEIAA